jgi:hypothetical protein
MFVGGKSSLLVGELNALMDELVVMVELFLRLAHASTLGLDVVSIMHFVFDCP